jgi:hypothetical protein
MKQDLINIITKLEADPRFAISVVNLEANKRVIVNATNDDLKAGYGSAKQFFESLFQKGIKRIRVCPRVQNGTVSGTNGTVKNFARSIEMPEFDFEFETKQEMQPAVAPVSQVHQAVPLNGGMYADMTNIYKIQHYDILKDDFARVKAERNQLRETNQELKRTIFEQETLGVKAVEKSKAQKELLEAGQGYAPVLIEILKGLKPDQNAIGLGAGLSPIKQTFIQADDSFLMELKSVADCFEKPGFEDELNLLLNKYKS